MNKRFCLFFLLVLTFQQTDCYNFSFYFNPTHWFTKISSFPSSLFELISRYSLATKHRLNTVETELRTNIQNSHGVVESKLQNLINKHKQKQSEGLGILKELVKKQSDEFSQIYESFNEGLRHLEEKISDRRSESIEMKTKLSALIESEIKLREEIKEISESDDAFKKKLIEFTASKNVLEQKIKLSEEKCKTFEAIAAHDKELARNVNKLIKERLGLIITASNRDFFVGKGIVSKNPVQLSINKRMDILND